MSKHTKIKLFSNYLFEALERDVNNFTKDKSVINIGHAYNSGDECCIVMVTYEECEVQNE